MSINFSTNSLELQREYKKVLDGDQIDWALFVLKGADLALDSSGTGGLSELQDEWEGSKIQFAFVRVMDPGSNLPKFVLISYCGEGVPTSRKGLFNVTVNEVFPRVSS